MIELSIPAVLGMVVVGLYNMMDSIFVGQMVGDVQMGAISVSYPLTLINAGSAAMLGVGSASVLSRAIGKKDENTIKKIMGNLGAMVLLLSVIYTVVGVHPPAFVPDRSQRQHFELCGKISTDYLCRFLVCKLFSKCKHGHSRRRPA